MWCILEVFKQLQCWTSSGVFLGEKKKEEEEERKEKRCVEMCRDVFHSDRQ